MTGFDSEEVAAVSIVADGGGGDAEEETSTPSFARVVEVEDDRGAEVVRNLPVEEDLFSGAVVVDRVFGRGAEVEAFGGELVELGVAVKGVISAKIGLVGKRAAGDLFSGGAGLGFAGSDGFAKLGTAVFGPFEGLGKNGALPAGNAVALGVKDVPPLGVIGRLDEAGVTDAESFGSGLEDGLFELLPRFGIERIVSGEFEETEFIAGEPGSATGIGNEGAILVFKDLGTFVKATAFGGWFGKFPRVIVVFANENTLCGELRGRRVSPRARAGSCRWPRGFSHPYRQFEGGRGVRIHREDRRFLR